MVWPIIELICRENPRYYKCSHKWVWKYGVRSSASQTDQCRFTNTVFARLQLIGDASLLTLTNSTSSFMAPTLHFSWCCLAAGGDQSWHTLNVSLQFGKLQNPASPFCGATTLARFSLPRC